MKIAKRVVIPVDMSTEISNQLKPLRDLDFINECEIHFVYVFRTVSYPYGIGEYPLTYPILTERQSIEESVVALLARIGEEVLTPAFKGKKVYKCLFNDSPKERFTEYVKDVKADMIIIPTRKKHGLFESSFAAYVNKHTEANMILLKNWSAT